MDYGVGLFDGLGGGAEGDAGLGVGDALDADGDGAGVALGTLWLPCHTTHVGITAGCGKSGIRCVPNTIW